MSDIEYVFYAILDREGAIVSVDHEKYGELKAIFRTYEDAERAIELQNEYTGLHIEKCEVVQA